jgi:hypothetical protein
MDDFDNTSDGLPGVPEGINLTLEPTSALNTKSPYARVTQTKSGHLQIFDDTPGSETIRTQHGKTGSYIEMRPDGSEVHKIFGKGWYVTVADHEVSIGGNCKVVINGNSTISVNGNVAQSVQGDYDLLVNGDYSLTVKGKSNITSAKDMTVGVASLDGKLKFASGSSYVIDSDLRVSGSITGSAITSTGAITAGTGIHAGIKGSLNPIAGITTSGGLNVGVPPATPTAVGMVNATVSVTAPIVYGTVMVFSPLLLDNRFGAPGIRMLHNVHTHQAKGAGVPNFPMPLP